MGEGMEIYRGQRPAVLAACVELGLSGFRGCFWSPFSSIYLFLSSFFLVFFFPLSG